MNQDHATSALGDRARRLDEEMAEVSLLLPVWQAAALERLARTRGLTVGHLLRLLIQDYLACPTDPERPSPAEGPDSRGHERGVLDPRLGNRFRGWTDQ
jgi:hypothetical protein